MDVFSGIDIGTYSNFRLIGQQHPEVVEIIHHSATVGAYLWLFFLAILVGRWWYATGQFPLGDLVKVLGLILAVEAIRHLIGRPRPDDAQDYFGEVFSPGFPNGPTFRAVLISALMWETTTPGWGRWLGLLGAVLYCVWVMMIQLIGNLAYLTDVLASIALALAISFLAPRIFRSNAARRSAS